MPKSPELSHRPCRMRRSPQPDDNGPPPKFYGFGTSSLTPIGICRVSRGRRAISKAAQEHWRYVNDAHLVALVRARVNFEKGVLVERPEQAAQAVTA
jgi:hypothetical protein